MTHRIRLTAIAAAMAALLVAVAEPALARQPDRVTPNQATQAGWSETQAGTSVLLLGNSYTNGVHNAGRLDGFFERGPDVDATLTYRHPGGWWLRTHAEDPTSTGLITDTERHAWDVVVLQDYSLGPALASRDDRLATLDSGGPALIALIAAHHPHARVVLFNTWPRRRDNDQLVQHFDNDPERMLRHIKRGYRYIAGSNPEITSMALVGDAFVAAMGERPELELYGSDGSHASTAGSYLAAAVIYQAVTGRSPVDSRHRAGLSESDAAFLQRIAAGVAPTPTPTTTPTTTPPPSTTPTPSPTPTPTLVPPRPAFLPVLQRGTADRA